MRYRNKSRHKMLLQLGKDVREILPNQEFESSELLNYSFLEEVKSPQPKVIRKSKVKKQSQAKEIVDGSDNSKN